MGAESSPHDRGGSVCSRCDFFLVIDRGPLAGDWGMCRRHAPVVIAERSRDEQGRVTSQPRSVFPMVQPTDWCGDWERRA